jgi:hypothetical protein
MDKDTATKKCDICGGYTRELKEYQHLDTIAGDDPIMICPYCFHSTTSVLYNLGGDKEETMRHINNMFNILEMRIQKMLER